MSLWSAMKEGWKVAKVRDRAQSDLFMLQVIAEVEKGIRADMVRVVESLGTSIEAAAKLAGVALQEVSRDLGPRRQAEIARKIQEIGDTARMWQDIRDTLHEGGPLTG